MFVKTANLVSSLAAVASFAGCVTSSVQPYPTHWPALEQDARVTCSSIDGTYSDEGEPAEPDRISITQVLLGLRPWDDATHISIAADTERLRFEVWRNDDLLTRQLFAKSEGEYSCDGERIVIHTKLRFVGEGVSGKQTATVRLFPFGEYLVLHKKSDASGQQMFVPSKWSTDSWYRARKLN